MIKSVNQYRDLYEISLEIGRSLNLYEMLRSSVNAYLKKLNCITGIVHRVITSDNSAYRTDMIFSKPYALVARKAFKEIEKLVPKRFSSRLLEAYISGLPSKGQCDDDLYFHVMNLKSFGFLILIKKGEYIPESIIQELGNLNDRLAESCKVCIKNEALEESELRYRHHQQLLPEMMCETNTDGLITFANNYALEKMGYSMQELKEGIPLISMFHPTEHKTVLKNFSKAMKVETFAPHEYTLVKKDGTSFPVLIYTNRLLRNKKLEGLISIIIDISAMKENEKKVREYTERLELALIGSNAGLWDWNINTHEIVLNDRWLLMRGFDTGKTSYTVDVWKSLLHPDDSVATLRLLDEHLAGKTPFYQAEYRSATKSGDYIWILDTGKVMEFDNDGKPLRVIGTNINITGQKENELILQQNLKQQELLSEIALELNSLEDFEKRISTALSQIGAHTGVSRVSIFEDSDDGLITFNTFEWCNYNINPHKDKLKGIPYNTIPSWKEILTKSGRVYSENVDQLPEDIRLILKPQEIKSVIVYPLIVGGIFYGFIGFDECTRNKQWSKSELELLRTVSGIIANAFERKKMEKSIIDERDRAHNANKAKSEFLANMSHEIRTPMNAVLGFSEALFHKLESEEHRKMIKSVLSSGNLLLSLLNDILDLSKIEAGKLEISLQPINLKSILQEIKLLFIDKVRDKGIEINIIDDNKLPDTLVLDEIRIKQVLFNLVGNAVKFTHRGYINVRVDYRNLTTRTGELSIEVEDTGIGIPESQKELIFEAFRQQSGQSNRLYGGIGLGLAISRRLVEKMNGSINVSSKEGKGSVFRVIIPDVEMSSADLRRGETNDFITGIEFEKSTLLVVDDVETNIEAVENLLSGDGLKILSAENGEMALSILQHTIPDLILLDIRLPGMNGFEVAEKIKADPTLSHIPVIAFTASVFSMEKIDNPDIFDGFLIKPVNRNDLISQMVKFLKYHIRDQDNLIMQNDVAENEALTGELHSLLPQLLQKLENDFLPKWELVKDQLILFRIEEFAVKVKHLGEEYQYQYLVNYAEKLLDELESVDLDSLKKTMNHFPRIIAHITSLINNS
jgi:PAS domain S-box-containing protein